MPSLSAVAEDRTNDSCTRLDQFVKLESVCIQFPIQIMTTAGRARKRARPDQVYQKLRQLIIDGRLAPGTRVIETDVAERLGVSRTPVRGALQRLQQEGYIIASGTGQQSRLAVAPLTQEDARELFAIVGEIEGLGARWSAELAEDSRSSVV